MLPVFRLVRYRFLNHLISMSVITETQFTLFDRPSAQDGHQKPRRKLRAQLPDLVRDVGQLENNDLVDLIRVAIGEARRRGMATIALVGYDGGEIVAGGLADHVVITRSQHIPRIQEAQASAYHVLRELVG